MISRKGKGEGRNWKEVGASSERAQIKILFSFHTSHGTSFQDWLFLLLTENLSSTTQYPPVLILFVQQGMDGGCGDKKEESEWTEATPDLLREQSSFLTPS